MGFPFHWPKQLCNWAIWRDYRLEFQKVNTDVNCRTLSGLQIGRTKFCQWVQYSSSVRHVFRWKASAYCFKLTTAGRIKLMRKCPWTSYRLLSVALIVLIWVALNPPVFLVKQSSEQDAKSIQIINNSSVGTDNSFQYTQCYGQPMNRLFLESEVTKRLHIGQIFKTESWRIRIISRCRDMWEKRVEIISSSFSAAISSKWPISMGAAMLNYSAM